MSSRPQSDDHDPLTPRDTFDDMSSSLAASAGPSSSRFAPPPSRSASGRQPHHPYFADEYVQSRGADKLHDDEELEDPLAIDPELRLRTVTTAHSVIAESIRAEGFQERRKKRKRLLQRLSRMPSTMKSSVSGTVRGRAKRALSDVSGSDGRTRSSTVTTDLTAATTKTVRERGASQVSAPDSQPDVPVEDTHPLEKTKDAWPLSLFKRGKGQKKPSPRRTIYVNLPLPRAALTPKGEPIVRYVRNKVRTSKYTIITFLPKNLFEQFRRVANVYFLALVILQLFSIFGAPNAQIGMLPLLAILGMTAIKDGIEDWRRAKLDNEVNNSATTKLEGWQNVNQPRDGRSFFERMFHLGPAPGRPSKGVKKLRQKEADTGKQIVMDSQKEADGEEQLDGSPDVKQDYPMGEIPTLNLDNERDGDGRDSYRGVPRALSTPSIMSRRSNRSVGVLDWSKQASRNAQWERTLWKKLEVGDLVLLSDNEQVPADIIVLSTSNPDHLCFVETKNLDGETNLKVRKALKATAMIQSEEDLEHAHFLVDSEAPHANLYNYNGVLKYMPAGDKAETKQEAITINELLLRGCSIRNTKWVIGMVVFTGEDTKIMLNGGDTPSKRSKIEKETNFNVIMNFVLLMVLCLVTGILHGWSRSQAGKTSADYFEPDAYASSNIYLDSVIIFFSCLIVFQNIVPISLYITIEIVKTIQAFFIFQDVEMYYDVYDTPCVPKTWNISDDLGQIEYVFSDKTGTLTQNIMEFKKCSIRGVTFGEGMTEAMMGAAKRDGQETGPAMEDQAIELEESKERMLGIMREGFSNRYLRDDKLTLISPDLATRLANPSDPLRPDIVSFFRALAICHSVLSDAPEPSKPFVLDYKAESPDEAALVAAARDVGFPFVTRNSSRVDIEVLGKPERWEPLRVLEFNSSRKRMSVIARSSSGQIILYCKGADSVIYERLAPDHDETLKQSTLKDLETFANGGLRTLCIAYRVLSEEEFQSWATEYDAACAATVDRETEIERSCEKIEHTLYILGATALEDKLQEGVPDSIATLHKAGIKLWILTGDKLQTAIEIGYSCNLLTNDMEVMIISTDSEEGARAQIEAGINKMASVLGPPPIPTKKGKRQPIQTANTSGPTFAVVIDGESLRYALQPNLKGLFLSLGMQCAAVICCRVSPSQKALTVRLVKEGCNAMTLAIGDGANDVAMIQEANVGVGLFGLEGSQAAMSADYAFGQFRFLTRLLLVHGRWSYVRIADMHANFFYKNVIWTLSMFWFLIFNSFDGTYLFDYTLLLFYNLFFTSVPVAVMGAFDQDTNAKASLAFPQLYKRGILGLEYTRLRFWLYMLDGLYQSAIIFFIPYLALGDGSSWRSDGLDTDALTELGSVVAAAGVIAANGYVGINTRYWTIVTAVVIILSTLLYYIWVPIYSALAALPFSGEASVLFPTFSFWAVTLLTVSLAIGPRWLARAVQQSYFPRDKDIVREAWITRSLKQELGIRRRRSMTRDRKASAGSRKVSGSSVKHASGTASPPREADDELGYYSAAATYTPQKDYSRSPAFPALTLDYQPGAETSNASRPTYPPAQSLISPLPSPLFDRRAVSTVPPPLGVKSPARGSPAQSPPLSAKDRFNLANAEIDRLSRNSIEIRRASLADGEERLRSRAGSPEPRPATSRKTSHGSGGGTGSGNNSKRSSLSAAARYDHVSPTVSPTRSGFDHASALESRLYGSQSRVRPPSLQSPTSGHTSPRMVDSPTDFSISSPGGQHENVGWGSSYASKRDTGASTSGWAV